MEATLVPVPGCFHRGCSSSHSGNNGCLPYRLWRFLRQPSCLWSLEERALVMAHTFSGVACRLSGFESVPPNGSGLPSPCQDRQSPQGDAVLPHVASSATHTPLVCFPYSLQNKFLSLRTVYVPGVTNLLADFLSRHSLESGEWRLHPQTVYLTMLQQSGG